VRRNRKAHLVGEKKAVQKSDENRGVRFSIYGKIRGKHRVGRFGGLTAPRGGAFDKWGKSERIFQDATNPGLFVIQSEKKITREA